jgi:hypothetical protein
MKREFILQQTTIPEKKYNSQVLIGNWYEEKCNPSSQFSKFHRERKFEPNKYNSTTLKEVPCPLSQFSRKFSSNPTITGSTSSPQLK